MWMSERSRRMRGTVLSSLHGCFAVRSVQVQALYCLDGREDKNFGSDEAVTMLQCIFSV